jgi:hypothetical protein
MFNEFFSSHSWNTHRLIDKGYPRIYINAAQLPKVKGSPTFKKIEKHHHR